MDFVLYIGKEIERWCSISIPKCPPESMASAVMPADVIHITARNSGSTSASAAVSPAKPREPATGKSGATSSESAPMTRS